MYPAQHFSRCTPPACVHSAHGMHTDEPCMYTGSVVISALLTVLRTGLRVSFLPEHNEAMSPLLGPEEPLALFELGSKRVGEGDWDDE